MNFGNKFPLPLMCFGGVTLNKILRKSRGIPVIILLMCVFPRCFFRPQHSSGKKNEHKLELLGPDIFQRGGGLQRAGAGAKIWFVLRNSQKTNFWRDIPGILLGYPRGARKL